MGSWLPASSVFQTEPLPVRTMMRVLPDLGSCAATSCGMGGIREPLNPVVNSVACMAGRYRSAACGAISRFTRSQEQGQTAVRPYSPAADHVTNTTWRKTGTYGQKDRTESLRVRSKKLGIRSKKLGFPSLGLGA